MEKIPTLEITKKDTSVLNKQQVNVSRGLGYVMGVWLVGDTVGIEIKPYAALNSWEAKNKPTHWWQGNTWVDIIKAEFVTRQKGQFDVAELVELYDGNDISLTNLTPIQLSRAIAIGAPHHLWLTPKSFFVLAVKSSIPTHVWQNNEWVAIDNPVEEEKIVLDDGHFHEALHATHIIRDMFYSHVVECPAVDLTPELKAMAEKAADGLNDLYQAIGLFDHNRTAKEDEQVTPPDIYSATFQITPAIKDRWDALCVKCEVPANSQGYNEILTNAMRLFEDVVNKAEAGHKFHIENKDGSITHYDIFGKE